MRLCRAKHRSTVVFGGPTGCKMIVGTATDPRLPMKSLADALPPEIAHQIHPDWRKNEAAYWVVRDQLLSQYQGQWIGFADGVVVAFGSSPVAVFHAAEASGRNPFVTCVGRED